MSVRTAARAARPFGTLLVLVAVGCGGATSDEDQVGDVVKRYLEAVSDEDWTAVCDTRSRKERKEAEEFAGSCERVMARAFRDLPKDAFDGARLSDVRIEGDTAAVDVYQRGREDKTLTLAAVRESGGEWRLEALSEGETP